MGQERACLARFRGRSSSGRARLEDKLLDFKGTFHLKIPREAITSVSAERGTLKVRFAEGTAEFDLEAHVEKWAQQLLRPRSLLDKLGVKPDSKVLVLGLDDSSFLDQLRDRTNHVSTGRAQKGLDLIFVSMRSRQDLRRLDTLRRYVHPRGAIWVIWPKGQKAFRDIRDAGPEYYDPGRTLLDTKRAPFEWVFLHTFREVRQGQAAPGRERNAHLP